MKKFFFKVLAGILTIYLADKLISVVDLRILPGRSNFLGFSLNEYWQILILTGTVLGLINFFVKPILDKITLPLKLLTFGFFGLILNMLIIWALDILFLEFSVEGIYSLFLAGLIATIINFIFKLIT